VIVWVSICHLLDAGWLWCNWDFCCPIFGAIS
jgi:hypothetical protein